MRVFHQFYSNYTVFTAYWKSSHQDYIKPFITIMEPLYYFHYAVSRKPATYWALSMLIALTLSVLDVDAMDCKYNNVYTMANCSARGKEIVPFGLYKSIQMLDMSSNYFPTLEDNSFIGYKYLTHLYLQNNSIKVVESRAFASLYYLRHLDLSNNKLTAVPTGSFGNMNHSLTELILSGNKIYIIGKGTFANLVNLQRLDLSGNSIYRVDYGGLRGLRSLIGFSIHRNALTYLPSDSFADFPPGTVQVRLYDNRWFCDCRMRWLWRWLNKTDSAVWDTEGYPIQCDGPSIVREQALDTLPLSELACEVQMKTSSFSKEYPKGANVTLTCVYSSTPSAEAKWLINSEIIEANADPKKYVIDSWTDQDYHGDSTQISELRIYNFQYEDIAKYRCFVQNIRGDGSTEYRLTLEGVDFDVVTPAPSNISVGNAGVDTRSVVIAVAVVCGIILLIVIGVLIFCSVNRVQKKKQEKRDAIVANVKQHFINSELMSNGDLTGLDTTKGSSKSMEDKLDGIHDDQRSNSNHTNDSNLTALKRPLDLEETEPLYIFEQPGSPFNNGNTYVSFGSELTDPADYSTPQMGAYPHHMSTGGSTRYESSHAGSATPLLERYTPSMFDSDEPTEDYAQYPVYNSLTNSLQHPNHVGNGDTSFYSNPGTMRTDSTGSSNTSNYHRPNEPAKRMSSFHYPQSVASSGPPRTPGSMRSSTLALGARYPEYGIGDGSPRNEPYYAPPAASTMDYRDYREMRYPTTTPPPHRMTPSKKSMSVGNLGYSPMTSTGPRKPPRLYQSREYMELTPQETPTNGDYNGVSSDAQHYSQSYGITPGTPV